jgi:hypothetical protein
MSQHVLSAYAEDSPKHCRECKQNVRTAPRIHDPLALLVFLRLTENVFKLQRAVTLASLFLMSRGAVRRAPSPPTPCPQHGPHLPFLMENQALGDMFYESTYVYTHVCIHTLVHRGTYTGLLILTPL